MPTHSSPTSVVLPSSSFVNPATTTMANNKGADIDVAASHNNINSNNPRSWILQVGVSAGRLCGVANSHLLPPSSPSSNHVHGQRNNNNNNKDTALVLAMTELLLDLYHTSQSLNLHLGVSIHKKLALNNRKYPVELCKGKAGKYTQYSQVTGVTVDNQSTMDDGDDQATSSSNSRKALTLPQFILQVPSLVEEIQIFAEAREWSKFHLPRNLILALLGEVGELAELVQWKGDDNYNDNDESLTTESLLSETELDKVSQELADVSIYLLRLASVTGVTDALVENMELAAACEEN